MNSVSFLLLICSFLFCGAQVPINGFRPPAVPLIVMDPYMNIWSMASNLTDDYPKYWDGTIKALTGLIRIDGVPFRFMGPSAITSNAMQQISVAVFPTQTVYRFSQNGVGLNVIFTTPLLTDDYDLLSRPFTYITFQTSSLDGKPHSVQLYYDNTAEIAVDTVDEQVVWNRPSIPGHIAMRIGTSAQNIFGKSGDGVGIDWGYAYIAAPQDSQLSSVMVGSVSARNTFLSLGKLPASDDTRMPRAASDDWPVLAFSWNFQVSSDTVSKYFLFGYDDIFSIEYFGLKLRPYWFHLYNSTQDITGLLQVASRDYLSVLKKAAAFDAHLLTTLNAVGGDKYATVAALAYRQTVGGCKLVWNHKEQDIWYFMKEISSDGDLSTVDVIFPASPFFVYSNADLLRRLMLPLLTYANNETTVDYTFTWAPHHLGYYPIGYILSKDQENMPIEETGNLMMMIASILKKTGRLDGIVPQYSALLEQWGRYLVSSLPDPENQLCTDDFEGPIPHDSNLAVKGIIGIDCYAYILRTLGNATGAQYYNKIALNYASDWLKLANPDNQDHYRLRYDQPGFSLKYNLLFQKILGLNTFPQPVFNTEIKYYLTNQLNPYGVPLDNRHPYTKLDWECWVAAIAPDMQSFHTLIDAVYAFAHNSPSRVPLSDWYQTDTSRQQGFQARPVVGGVFAKMAIQG